MSRLVALLLPAVTLLAAVRAAGAQPVEPLPSGRFSFPGAFVSAASAASASLALADRWLGSEPYDNPAAFLPFSVALSPQVIHVGRQDLRATNRNVTEQGAFFDAAGGRFSGRIGGIGLHLYAHQPVLRLEENAYSRGNGLNPSPPPASISSSATSREVRTGLAVSAGLGAARVGVAGEWVRRDDGYRYAELSGVPDPGTTRLDFSGSGFALVLGARAERRADRVGGVTVGAAARILPALSVTGAQRRELTSGTTVTAIDGEREAGWEAGASARVQVTPGLGLLAAAGARAAQDWPGLGVGAGRGSEWRLAAEFHDARDPWTGRVGFASEEQSGVPEPRGTRVTFGLGWDLEGTRLDVALVHSSLHRSGAPNSSDDRAIVTVGVLF